MREFGQELAKQAFPKKPRKKKEKPVSSMSKGQAKLHRKFLRQNAGVNWHPEERIPKAHYEAAVVEPMEEKEGVSKLRFDHDNYIAAEIAVLTRTGPDTPLRPLIMNLKNVRIYVDQYGSMLLRPTLAPEQVGSTYVLGGGNEAVQGVRRGARVARPVAAIVLGGALGLNPSKEGTKRFFLVESILMGGTAVEIVKRADKMARKGGYKRGDVLKVITPTTKKVTAFAELTTARIVKAGKRASVVVVGKKIQIQVQVN